MVNVFGEARVCASKAFSNHSQALTNATLVGGAKLNPADMLPPAPTPPGTLAALLAMERIGAVTTHVPTDELGDLDYANAALRISIRKGISATMHAATLWD